MQGQNVFDEFLKIPVYYQGRKYDDTQQSEYNNATVFHLMTLIEPYLGLGFRTLNKMNHVMLRNWSDRSIWGRVVPTTPDPSLRSG
jgi:hypothetical protein